MNVFRRNIRNKKYELKNGGYGWIDHVAIENVYKIILEDEEDDKW